MKLIEQGKIIIVRPMVSNPTGSLRALVVATMPITHGRAEAIR